MVKLAPVSHRLFLIHLCTEVLKPDDVKEIEQENEQENKKEVNLKKDYPSSCLTIPWPRWRSGEET